MIDYNEKPFIVIWEVTRACELHCLHCRAEAQVNRNPYELSTDEGKALIDDIAQMDGPMLVFTGGDPLMREDIFELAAYAVNRGVRVSMTPSATPNVTKENMQRAKEVGLSRWAFSIDGPNKQIHDHFRGTEGSFDLTMNAIQYLKALKMPLQINTVISRYNIDYLEEMAQMVEDLGCVLWSVFFLVPTGRGKESDMVTPAQHEEVFRFLNKLRKTASFGIKTTSAQHYRRVVLQEQIREMKKSGTFDAIKYEDSLTTMDINTIDGLGRAPKGVNDGNGFVFVSHLGHVYPSGLLPVSCGNIREKPLSDIYVNSPILQNLRNPDLFKGKCGMCEFRYVCGGSRSRAYAVTGDYMESEPYCVYQPKQWIQLQRKLKQAN
ncbi:TIGR04053 family radical SAM/SPASM domain-containing protein [Macrococcus capreoli]|uniref:TIGR04053 family radical SAM/SPASM domain-containing protein n=1 Tax=Macrococcus capreoli TaxID=2982690 RepID=UPI0021D5A1BD|nr:TIGR04053 family radical SAM/SPASM domain-containing protein [Macrococcus sp. TMW 2.2395]MCU7557791.1 TIGR04053 family radical SAM/SPASM domain-containing protein [Macrococcus sp. TMW 2.2395]